MKKHKFTYEKSGVNIKAADNFVKFISNISSKNKGNKKFNNIGSFGSISDIPKNFKRPKIVTSTDGVGTKFEIANILNKYDTIGIDLVAMCVNDLIVQGAKPLLFLDYISINKIDLKKLKSIIKGIVKGCKISGCELVGGETAEMPGTYEKGKFDIAGFSVGIVDENKILGEKKIKKNNLILAITSNGIHSNGYSLVRYIIDKRVNPARLVAHGYAERWHADMTWADMRRGYVQQPIGDNITIETGRSGIPEYKGVDMGRDGLPLENISMNTIIDSLNSTMEMRTKNRRIKIIFTQQNYVDGTTPYKTPEKFR